MYALFEQPVMSITYTLRSDGPGDVVVARASTGEFWYGPAPLLCAAGFMAAHKKLARLVAGWLAAGSDAEGRTVQSCGNTLRLSSLRNRKHVHV